MSLVVRRAVPGDACRAAELIYSTGPESFNLVYGFRDRAKAIISRMFANRENICSHEYSTVVAEGESVIGIIVLFEKKDVRPTQAQTGNELLRMVGPFFLLFRMPVFIRQARLNPEPCEGELFVADVAVSPDARGRGIAKLLMREAERIALERNLSTISLGVSKNNEPAIGLYRSMGYSITTEKTDDWLLKRFGIAGVYKMVKQISC